MNERCDECGLPLDVCARHADIDELIERSSLGTEGAKALRARTPPEVVERIMRKADAALIRSLVAENQRLQEDLGRVDGALFNAIQRLTAIEAENIELLADVTKKDQQLRCAQAIITAGRYVEPMTDAERQVLDRLNEANDDG